MSFIVDFIILVSVTDVLLKDINIQLQTNCDLMFAEGFLIMRLNVQINTAMMIVYNTSVSIK